MLTVVVDCFACRNSAKKDTAHRVFQLAFYHYNKNNGKTQQELRGKTAGIKDAIAWDRQRQKQDWVIMD